MGMVPTTAERVRVNTERGVQARIRERMRIDLAYFEKHPEEIEERLGELDREWDVERCLETGSSCLSLAGLALGAMGKRKWLLLPLVVQSFFLQHGVQGWCPPLPVFRGLGVRTQMEIEEERHALLRMLEKREGTRRGENAGGREERAQVKR
ncbi:MAG: hypothetical protein ACTHN5_05000 [Phycisphaerae bacterium]